MARRKVERSEIIRFSECASKMLETWPKEEVANFILDNLGYQGLLKLVETVENRELTQEQSSEQL